MRNSFFKIALSAAVILLAAMVLTGDAQAWKQMDGTCHYMAESEHDTTDYVRVTDGVRNWGCSLSGPDIGNYTWEYSIRITMGFNGDWASVSVHRLGGYQISPYKYVYFPSGQITYCYFTGLPYYQNPD